MGEFKNYYEILEVPENADPNAIYEGYNRVKASYNGDNPALYSIMSNEECDSLQELIEEAYSILSVPAKRKQYDSARGFNSTGEHPLDIEEDFQLKTEVMSGSLKAPEPKVSEPPPASSYESEREFSIGKSESNISKFSAQKRFGLEFKRDTDFETEIENKECFTGDFLRRVREYKNVDIPRMSDMTRISKTYLQAIENEDLEKLPAMVYVRGFVYQYAKCLKLSPNLVATSYVHHVKGLKENS